MPTHTTTPPPPPPSPEFLALVSHEFARRHLVLSAGFDGNVERLLIGPPTRLPAAFNVGVRLGRPVRTEVHPAEDVAAAIDRAYLTQDAGQIDAPPTTIVESSGDVESDLASALREAEQDLLSTRGKTPAVRLVDLILFEALQRGASDVHVQPLRQRTLVRYRLDGALHTARELPGGGAGSLAGSGEATGSGGGVAGAIVSRIKVMASLDVAERRAPQDGRATVSIAGRRIDLRVSTLPSTYGERVVLRLLDPSRSPHLQSFAGLGMPDAIRDAYLAHVSRTSGIVLSTGPTGSGKTTTLYATLAWISDTNAGSNLASNARDGAASRSSSSLPPSSRSLSACELNIMTIEDPVEYDLSGAAGAGAGARGRGGARDPHANSNVAPRARAAGLSISQTQVDPKKNVTFATGLRHILRQDPDVIMVGEIRDEETARIAVQASLTGHLVLSTLHTSDAASAIARLLDLGVEPFLVASSLSAVLAQRLVRTLHAPCGGRGCDECLGGGFKGRVGLFELLVIDEHVRPLIGERASSTAIKDAARRRGMTTLRESGEGLVTSGLTTAAEVDRVIDMHEEEVAS